MGMLDELKRMSKAVLGVEDNSTEAPSTELSTTEVPTTEVPDEFETDAPTTEGFQTDAPGTTAPVTEVPNDVVTLKSEIELLRKEIKELKEPSPTQAPSTDAPIDEHNFMEGLDVDEIVSDPDKFNALLNNVYKKGILFARGEMKHGSDNLMNTLPNVISSNVAIIQELSEISNNFYNNNKDLKPYQDNVASAFGEISAENPDKTYEEVLNLTADKVRESLGLKKATNNNNQTKPPKLPTNKGNRRTTKSELKGVESEIDSMNKALGI